jgi:CDP-diacylglycerol--glycerol-3-phosphate 3-phosphatidyltransferase
MASIYDLKPRFQALLRPLVRALAKAGVSANQVTVAALMLSVLAGLGIGFYPQQRPILLLIPIVLFVRMALNAIDGMLAREFNMKTSLGAVLNELGDVLADSALYLPLALVPGFSATWIVVVVVLAVISEMTGVIGVQIGASRRYDGPMGKSDRAFAFGLLALLLGLGVPAGSWLQVVLMLMALLLAATVVNRARQALKEVC